MIKLKQFRIGANTVFDRTINFLAYFAGALIVLTMLGVAAEITSRKLLHTSLMGVIEVSEYFLLYITFLGTAWLLKRDEHVKMDIVLNQLGLKSQAMANFATSVVVSLLCIAIAWFSAITTWDMFQRGIYLTTVLETPVAPLLAPIPLGFFLLFIQFLRRAYGNLEIWRGVKPPEKGGAEDQASL